MANLASIHNHPSHGFNSPSDKDIDNMLHNPNEKYCIVLSENKIWIVKNKYHNIDLREKDNYPLCVDCLNIVQGVRKIFENNKVKMLDDINSIENLNSTVDKEINSVFDELNVYSKIIKV
jgi:nucleoside-triphosphatase THEP1